jgi:ABC transporter substrate binding protein
LTSNRKIKANRANARASTGPKTARGRARAARNAFRHGLSLPVCSDPFLSEEVEALAREIAGPEANARIQELARRVAEAQIDLRRVRHARHQLLSNALNNPYYDSRANLRVARPGGNATGFTIYEYGMSGKWLELLKEIAPRVTRAAVLRDPAVASGIGQFGAVQIVAPSFGVELSPVDVRDAGEIERAVTEFARGLNGGLIVTGSAAAIVHRELIATLAARHRLPAVYPGRYSVTAGGLISYGPDLIDQFRRAAGYVDRILRGEKPADLPVQAPTKYELVINLKTAKALGLEIPATVLARADEVIE